MYRWFYKLLELRWNQSKLKINKECVENVSLWWLFYFFLIVESIILSLHAAYSPHFLNRFKGKHLKMIIKYNYQTGIREKRWGCTCNFHENVSLRNKDKVKFIKLIPGRKSITDNIKLTIGIQSIFHYILHQFCFLFWWNINSYFFFHLQPIIFIKNLFLNQN